MGEGRRGIDERHDAQAVVHEGHVRNNDVHDGLWWREQEEEDSNYSFAVTKIYVIFIIFTLKSINTHRELNVPVSCYIIKDADMLIVLDYLANCLHINATMMHVFSPNRYHFMFFNCRWCSSVTRSLDIYRQVTSE